MGSFISYIFFLYTLTNIFKGGSTSDEKKGVLPFPVGQFMTKGLSLKGGAAKIQLYQESLRKLIENGKAKPSFVFIDEVRIEDGAKAYRNFGNRKTVKAVFHFDVHHQKK